MTEATEMKPNQWRKKPVVITAVQLNTIEEARAYPPVCQGGLTCKSKGAPDGAWPHIHTLEGDHTWREGDWCITGVNGEHYFCKPDIFAKTYEPSHMQVGASLTAAQKAGPVSLEALKALHHAVCGETGFAAAVRADSGLAYPWPALDIADELARAAIAQAQEPE
jgi:hypothetical protein